MHLQRTWSYRGIRARNSGPAWKHAGSGSWIREPNNMIQEVKYSALRDAIKLALRHGRADASASGVEKNRMTTLNGWLDYVNLTDEALVGQELTVRFMDVLPQYLDHLAKQGKGPLTVKSHRSHLRSIRAAYYDVLKQHMTDGRPVTAFHDLLLQGMKDYGSHVDVARAAGIQAASLLRWLRGKLPYDPNAPRITRLNNALGFPPGTLRDALRSTILRGPRTANQTIPAIKFRMRLARARLERTSLETVPDALRDEWLQYARYKTDIAPTLLRQRKGAWVIRRNYRPSRGRHYWACELEPDSYCPAALITWGAFTKFFYWVTEVAETPLRCGVDDLTIALIVDYARVAGYMNWLIARTDGEINRGHELNIVTFRTMLHPETGYLTQQRHFAERVGLSDSEEQWRARCADTNRRLLALDKALRPRRKASRDPFEPIRGAIELDEPLEAVFEMLRRMTAEYHPPETVAEAVAARDVLLILFLANLPMRARNLQELSYLPDNTGHLYQDGAGNWRLRFEPMERKNHGSPLAASLVDVPVNPLLGPRIERYLERFRPRMLRLPSKYFFVPGPSGPQGKPWLNLNARVLSLTRMYLPNCSSVGPHAFRHIVATSILKATGNWLTASLVLGSSESTVRAAYAFLQAQDGVRKYYAVTDGAMRKLG